MTEDEAYLELKNWLYETRDEPLEGMAAFFDRRVDGYEQHMSPWSEHYRYIAGLLPTDAETLLDIGCGTGLELDCIFETHPAIDVTGIDLSESMLAALRRKHPDKSLTLVQDDYFLHDFGEARFDAVTAFETLHHFTVDKKTALYKKLLRALKPGGVFLECDYIAVSQEIEDMLFLESARRRARDCVAPDAFVHFDTPLTLAHELDCLRLAGFLPVESAKFLPGDGHTAVIRASKQRSR